MRGQVQENKTAVQDSSTAIQLYAGQPKWISALISTTAVLLAGLIAAPLSLSGQDLMAWAHTGLGLEQPWPWVVFYALDATAVISVLICVYSAWTADRAGLFAVMVWIIALLSAFAQYRNGLREQAAPDAWWFFPIMALLSPLMLELVLAKIRQVQRHRSGQTAKQMPKFGLWRWVPGVGALGETYGAWRTARLLNLSSYEQAVQQYRLLCPQGGVRVLRAIREQDRTAVQGASTGQNSSTEVQEQASAEQAIKQVQDSKVKNSEGQKYKTTNLYETPVQEQPVRKKEQAEQVQDNEQYLEIIRATWPEEIPSGNKIRTKLGVNWAKSKKLIEQLEQERS